MHYYGEKLCGMLSKCIIDDVRHLFVVSVLNEFSYNIYGHDLCLLFIVFFSYLI